MTREWLIFWLVVAGAVAIVALVGYLRQAVRINALVRREVDQWREGELARVTAMARKEAEVALERWKAEHTDELRRDAVGRSTAVTIGKVFEQLVPYLPEFSFNPKDARFIGAPIDFIVFDGLNEDTVNEVVFLEVKTGSSTLSTRERRLRDAVRDKRVRWAELRIEARS